MNKDLLRVVVRLSGKPQKDIAKRLGVSPAFLCQILRGSRRPSEKIIHRLAKILNYPDPDELLDPRARIMVGRAS